MVPDGLSGLGGALEAMAKQGVTMKFDRVHKVLGEGNFVLTVSEGAFGGKPTSYYDLFAWRMARSPSTGMSSRRSFLPSSARIRMASSDLRARLQSRLYLTSSTEEA